MGATNIDYRAPAGHQCASARGVRLEPRVGVGALDPPDRAEVVGVELVGIEDPLESQAGGVGCLGWSGKGFEAECQDRAGRDTAHSLAAAPDANASRIFLASASGLNGFWRKGWLDSSTP